MKKFQDPYGSVSVLDELLSIRIHHAVFFDLEAAEKKDSLVQLNWEEHGCLGIYILRLLA